MRVLPVAGLMLALTGCASAPVVQDRWPPGAPSAVELGGVPFHPQTGYECGPAALATVLGHRGLDADADALVPEVYVPARKGSLQPELVAAARRRGLVVYPVRPTVEDLLAQLAAGEPVLILQNQGLRRLPVWHYAVVVGADARSDTFVLRSGKTRRRIEQGAEFLRRWDLADRWGVVALAPGSLPADPDWPRYLKAVADLESAGHAHGAAAAYEAALARAPSLSAARFGLANVHYRTGRMGEAATLYAGLAADPDYGVAALNNLANLELDRGCVPAARAALEEAGRRADPAGEFAAALEDTSSRLETAGDGAAACAAG
jgi:tetratricopeptide (TPR) repeat protein